MFYLKDGANMYKVKIEDIIYLQQEERNVRIATLEKEFMVKGCKIDAMHRHLGNAFFKCHSYLLININKVDVVKKHEVVLEGEKVVGMCYAATCRVKNELKKTFDIE